MFVMKKKEEFESRHERAIRKQREIEESLQRAK